jgi:hypothetical protein
MSCYNGTYGSTVTSNLYLDIRVICHHVMADDFFDLQESSSCETKTLRVDATDTQMKMQAELARTSARKERRVLFVL